MKKIKYYLAGALAGVILMSLITTFGAGTKLPVNAYQSSSVQFWIDGEKVALPGDMTALFYKDRIYTPAKFVAEQLGASVRWDADNEIVLITPGELAPKETPSPTNKPSPTATPAPVISYQSIPVRILKNYVEMNVYGLSIGEVGLVINFDLSNRSPYASSLTYVPAQAYVEINGKRYDHDYNEYSASVYTVVNNGYGDGYFSFSTVPSLRTNAVKLVFPVRFEGSSSSENQDFEFVFYLNVN